MENVCHGNEQEDTKSGLKNETEIGNPKNIDFEEIHPKIEIEHHIPIFLQHIERNNNIEINAQK